jgi:hypothetical protein
MHRSTRLAMGFALGGATMGLIMSCSPEERSFGGATGGGAPEVCSPGATRACYTGAEGTEGVGPCKAGTQTCGADGSGYGPCVGETIPQSELCDGVDNDCDAQVDAADPIDRARADAQLCEDQRGPCAGATKPNALCVDGTWQPCAESTYAAQVALACDDSDDCTVDAKSGPVCEGGCLHRYTCAERRIFTPVADATVRSSQPTTNFGTEPQIEARSVSSSEATKAYLRFDPFAGGVRYDRIDFAFLRLRPTQDGFFSIRVYKALASWAEGGITWATMPGLDVVAIPPIAQPGSSGELVFDISDLVRAWNDDPTMNFGFAIAPMSEFGSREATSFFSREGGEDAAPRLEILVNTRTVSLPVVADTHVFQTQPTANFGGQRELTFTTGPTGGYTHLLLQFDTQPVPPSATVLRAELVLHQLSGQWLGPGVAALITSPWNEYSATWNTSPGLDSTLIGTVQTPDIFGGPKIVTVTDTVTGWVSGRLQNHGLVIRNSYEGTAGADRSAQLGSRENPNADVRPEIRVYLK